MSRLLLVEDEEHLAYTLEFNLSRQGYEVTVVGTIAEAREVLGQGRIDLVILDIMLPDGLGTELARDIRKRGEYVPILMLTAKGSPQDIAEGLAAGADDYLGKPFDLGELLGRIAAILRRQQWARGESPERSQEPLQVGRARIDLDTRQVEVEGVSSPLSELEIRLILYLVKHQGRAVSRGELLEKVWELPADTQTRTVDNFMVRIRRLLEPDPSAPTVLLTVRGFGYRLEPGAGG